MNETPVLPVDQAARTYATDPSHHVVLEASAGTGKTRVLVDRYLALLAAGVDPRHVLAITFTRKAAASHTPLSSRSSRDWSRRALSRATSQMWPTCIGPRSHATRSRDRD